MSTLILYIILIFCIFLVNNLKDKQYSVKFCNSIIFLMVFVFCAIRYDITRDYLNYVKLFTHIRADGTDVTEVGYFYMNKIFSFSKYGFIYTFALCSFVCVYSFHKVFVRLGIVDWGWFFSITLLVVLMMNNQIRQAVAMSIFALSLPFVEKNKFFKFVLLMIVAFSIHFSSVACFGFYFAFKFFKNVNPSREIWLIVLGSSIMIYFAGSFYDVGMKLFEFFPQYSHYLDRDFFSSKDEVKSGLGILLMLFIAIILVLTKHKMPPRFVPFFNMAILYFMLFIVFSDLRVVQRIARYLFIFVVVACSQVMISKKVLDYYKYMLIVAVLIWFGRYAYLSDRPYHTIFSEKCKQGIFFDREDGEKKGERDLNKEIKYNFIEE